jgi:hypothetical protein
VRLGGNCPVLDGLMVKAFVARVPDLIVQFLTVPESQNLQIRK